jgi:predicted nucleic acid-binding protein
MDATFLLHFFAPVGTVGVPLDSNSQPVAFAKERVEALVKELEKTGARIIVGTPALSEITVRAGVKAAQEWIALMDKSAHFSIVPFDIKSAIQVAIMTGHSIKGEGGKAATSDTYAKMKYDRQIVAIAHTEGATVFYTDDGRQGNMATPLGMVVRGIADCPVPDGVAQMSMFVSESPNVEESSTTPPA